MKSTALTKYSLFIAAAIILALSCFIIFFRFNSIPKTLTFDEIEFAKLALLLEGKPYTPYSSYATGHATLYFYILLFSMKVLGIHAFALRLPAAIFGVFNSIVFFVVMYKSLGKIKTIHTPLLHLVYAVAGTFLFITQRWYFNFARFSFEGTFLLFLELMSLFFFLKYTDHRQKKWLFPSGIFAGLAYNSYQPGRLFVFLIGSILFLFILERKQNRLDFSFFSKKTIATFLTFFIPFIVCITPLSLYLAQHQDVRMYQLFYPANTEMTLAEKGEFLKQNITSTSLMFTVKGDVNGRHNYPNKPALNPIMSVLFVTGLLFALFHLKDKMNQLYVLYFFLSVVPTLLTYPWENPNMLRTITAVPAIVFFSITVLFEGVRRIEHKMKLSHTLIIVLLFFVVSASALYDIRTYFVHQAEVFREAFEAPNELIYYTNDLHETAP